MKGRVGTWFRNNSGWIYTSVLGVTIIMAIYLRYYFWKNPGFPGDMEHFFWPWGEKIYHDGFWSLYAKDYYPGVDYPPLIPFVTSLLMQGMKFLSGSLQQESFLYFFKILPTIFEVILLIVTGVYIYKSTVSYRIPLLLFIILQPGLAFVSTGWGQVDSVMSCFILLAFVWMDTEKYYLSTISLFLALLTKPQALLACLLFFLILLFQKKYREFIKQVILFVALLGMMTALFYFASGANFLAPYLGAIGRYTRLSSYAFNLWWAIFHNASFDITDTTIWWLFSYRTWGFIFFFLTQIPMILFLWKNHTHIQDILLSVGYLYLCLFLFSSQMHERYLYYAVALLGIPALMNRWVFGVYVLLTVTLFVNCFALVDASYHTFGFFKTDPIPQGWTQYMAGVNMVGWVLLCGVLIRRSHVISWWRRKTKHPQPA